MSSSNDPKIDPISEVGDGDLFRPRSPAIIQMEKDTVEQRVKESEALHIYQDFIDSMSECNMAGDLDAWCGLHVLPYTVHLDDLDKIVKTHDDTHKFFAMMTKLAEKHGVDHIKRVGESAQRISGDQIEGYHTCYLLKEGIQIVEPVDSRMRILKQSARWYLVEITNNLSNQQFPYLKPKVSDGLQTSHAIKSRMQD